MNCSNFCQTTWTK